MVDVAVAHGRAIHMVVTSAGISEPLEFESQKEEVFNRVLRINVSGTRNAIAGALPFLRRSSPEIRGGGRIVMVSSTAGLVGIWGFSAYSTSKFALCGLAQSLQQELLPWGIRICLALPSDTNTPLLERENVNKPAMTKKISGLAAVIEPDDMARRILDDSCSGRFFSMADVMTWIVACASAGIAPAPTIAEDVSQVLLASPLRLITAFFHLEWNASIASDAASIRAKRAELGPRAEDWEAEFGYDPPGDTIGRQEQAGARRRGARRAE